MNALVPLNHTFVVVVKDEGVFIEEIESMFEGSEPVEY